MAYAKKTWVSGETPLSAENMNNIENGIADAHEDISKLNTKISNIGTIMSTGDKFDLISNYASANGQLVLTKGVWIVSLSANSETFNADGYFEAWLDSEITNITENNTAQGTSAYNNSYPRVTLTRIYNVTEDKKTVYGRYYQTSGVNRTINYTIVAVRIA